MEPKITILKTWSEFDVHKLTYELSDAFPELYASIRATILGYILHKALYVKKIFDDNSYPPETLNVLVRSIPIKSDTDIASEYIMNVANANTFDNEEMHHLVTTTDFMPNTETSTKDPFTRSQPINLLFIYPGSRIHMLVGVDEGRATYKSCYSTVSHEEHTRNKKSTRFTSTLENNGEKSLQHVVYESIEFLGKSLDTLNEELQDCIGEKQSSVTIIPGAKNEVTIEMTKMSDNQSIPVLLQKIIIDEIEKKIKEGKKSILQMVKLTIPGPYERTKCGLTLVFTEERFVAKTNIILSKAIEKLVDIFDSLLHQLSTAKKS
jgi:hypothetical protein